MAVGIKGGVEKKTRWKRGQSPNSLSVTNEKKRKESKLVKEGARVTKGGTRKRLEKGSTSSKRALFAYQKSCAPSKREAGGFGLRWEE